MDAGLKLAERVASGKLTYNYVLGAWALGQKPFVSYLEQEVLKMETTASIRPALLEQTAGFVAGDVYADYPVRRDQVTAVEQVELLDRDGNVLTSCAVHLPLLEEVTSLRHSFTVKEGV